MLHPHHLNTRRRSDAGESLRDIMRASIQITELQHANVQLRFVASLLAFSMMFGMVDPALLLLDGTETLIYRVALATSFGPVGLGAAFVALAAGLVPFLAMQVVGCLEAVRRCVTKVTCLVLVLAGLLWCFLAWRSLHLDLGHVAPLVFARNGVGALAFALSLAMSLNAEQLRSLMEHPA